MKGPTEFSGLVYVKMDAKGVATTVFLPVRGKLGTKTTNLGKAMKAAFTTQWANFEVGADIDEKAAEAAELAAESLEDVEIADEAETPTSATADTLKPVGDTKPVGKLDKLQSDVEKLEALLKSMKDNSDADKHGELDGEFKNLVGEIQKKK